MSELLHLEVNGEPAACKADPSTTLLEALRYELGLTGSKQGCDKGDCGACTVRVEGEPTLACITLALAVEGQRVTTVEGLARGPELHPVQDCFDELGAAQCGFCTPGMIVMAKALLDENPDPTEDEIRFGIAGNICRCTGYTRIVEAIQAAAKEMRK